MSGLQEQLNIVKNRNHQLYMDNVRLRAALQEFVDRCDKGEVRSKRTYAQFKELLDQTNAKG